MSTATTLAILREIRTRLLTFAPGGGGATLATLLGSTATGSGSDGKLFLNQAPDSFASTGSGAFWAVLRLVDLPQQGFDGGFLLKGQAELILYGRPRRLQSDVERMADLVVEAWLNWMYTASGHISAMDITSRFTIDYEAPADRELVAVRLLLPFRCAPTFLTQYSA